MSCHHAIHTGLSEVAILVFLRPSFLLLYWGTGRVRVPKMVVVDNHGIPFNGTQKGITYLHEYCSSNNNGSGCAASTYSELHTKLSIFPYHDDGRSRSSVDWLGMQTTRAFKGAALQRRIMRKYLLAAAKWQWQLLNERPVSSSLANPWMRIRLDEMKVKT